MDFKKHHVIITSSVAVVAVGALAWGLSAQLAYNNAQVTLKTMSSVNQQRTAVLRNNLKTLQQRLTVATQQEQVANTLNTAHQALVGYELPSDNFDIALNQLTTEWVNNATPNITYLSTMLADYNQMQAAVTQFTQAINGVTNPTTKNVLLQMDNTLQDEDHVSDYWLQEYQAAVSSNWTDPNTVQQDVAKNTQGVQDAIQYLHELAQLKWYN